MIEAKFPRLNTDAGERVHVLATHLEIHSQFGAGLSLDAEQSMLLARALRGTAMLADTNADAYNQAITALEQSDYALGIAEDTLSRRVGWIKTIGMVLIIGAFVALAVQL